ncbi:hypothetical protein GCM10010329_03090 [Streptomyces spiroverticillatus]|nr:hypothetical protein GCM10010329_03090 [Streptomyces spiroverticillatus]
MGRLRAHMERLTARGFVPDVVPHSEDEVRQPDPKRVEVVRHALHYMSVQLAPCPIDEVRCVASVEPPLEEAEFGALWADASEGEAGDEGRLSRCTNTVFDPSEGAWEQVEVPYAPGRAGQAILSASAGLMWVWSLQGLPFIEVRRWLAQRCETHHLSNVLDAVKPEWAHFDTFRHAEHILAAPPLGSVPAQREGGRRRPTGALPGRSRQLCATDGCPNGTGAVEPEGWICYVCSRTRARRERTHRRHQNPPGR